MKNDAVFNLLPEEELLPSLQRSVPKLPKRP